MARCGHGGTVGNCDLCNQEGILGRSTKKEEPKRHSRTPGRRSGSPPPPVKGKGRKK